MEKGDEDHISLRIPQDDVIVDANIGSAVDVSVNHEIVDANIGLGVDVSVNHEIVEIDGIPQDDVIVDANIGPGVDVSVNHEIVEIDRYKVLSDSIEAKVKEAFFSPYVRECSIFRVHEKFHKMNERAYLPEVVSIGPLHHGKLNLQAMEPVKLIYMHDLLSRITIAKQYGDQVIEKNKESPIPNIAEVVSIFFKRTTEFKLEEESAPKTGKRLAILRKCAEFIGSKEEEARNCYSEPITHIKSDEFVEMMIIDGFFIIELFCRKKMLVDRDGYDPTFSKIGHFSSISRDLLLIENQIPIFVLTGLLVAIGLMGRETESRSIINLLSLHFFNFVPNDEDVFMKYLECRGKHLLSFLANTYRPSPKPEEVVNNKGANYEWKRSLPGKLFKKFRTRTPEIVQRITRLDIIKVMPNATEMKRSGIKFKKGSTKGSFLDIKFNNKKGELEIPPLVIQDMTEILYRNLIAYEQCSDGKVTYMTSYGIFMNFLIDSAEDVRILRSKGIIKHHLGSDGDVANLFNKLCCDVIVMLPTYYYSDVCDELDKYCRKDINIWRATLMRDYCNTPWATISFLAATLLLILTLTSAIFGVLSFFVHHS